MRKGQYQLLIGIIFLTSVAVSVGIVYYFSTQPNLKINQTTTTSTFQSSTTTSSPSITSTSTTLTSGSTSTSTTTSSSSITTTTTRIISYTCQASTPQSFQTCISQAKSGQITAIEVTSMINCEDSTECVFVLQNIKGPLSIYGYNPNDGFKRNNVFNYQLLSIVNSNVFIHDLRFEDDSSTYCPPLNGTLCRPLLYLGNVGNITIDKIQIINGKNVAMIISYLDVAPNITISNSTFFGIGAHAILTYNHFVGGTIKVIDNIFQNTSSNALALSITSPVNSPSLIQGNQFIHNHKDTIYHICGASHTERCGGGQLYIFASNPGFETTNVIIKGNLFQDGYLDDPITGQPCGVKGIELDQFGIHYVNISGNGFIRDDVGIIINLQSSQLSNSTGFVIKNNIFNSTKCQNINPLSYTGVIDMSNNVNGSAQDAFNAYLSNRNVAP